MIVPPSGVRVWLATGATDMRRGMNSLALQVQEALHRDPHAGDLYVFRGKRGDLLKILWHDGLGMSLYAKDWNAASSSGRHRRTVWFLFQPRSLATCWKALTGGTHNEPGGRRWRADSLKN
jgi:transposase